ncbi:unnamed protein product [Ascophyllum nodosum]
MTKFGNCRRKVYRGGSIGSVIPIISPASVAALAMLISQAQGLSITPASFSHHAKHSLSSMSLYLSVYGVPTDGKRRRSEALHWLYPRSKRSELMMANPEGTQQLRDRDLEFMFYDEAQVYVRGGSGGQGAASFRVMAKKQRGQPNGGSGGKGGDVTLVCEESLNTLVNLRGNPSFVAESGVSGEQRYTTGGDGASIEVSVPPGTVVRDRDNGGIVLGELRERGERLLVAKGGFGGKGNASTKVTRGQTARATPAGGGEKRWLSLELRLVADVGLVGVPSAGKSTLLAAATNAKPKIADYPFTTLVPNLGVCDPEALGFTGAGMVLADIPGLLEGAHRGVGLGRAFLRHVERCRAIIHVVSGASPDPVGDFKAINQELELFSQALAQKPQVVVLNKIDLMDVEERRAELEDTLKHHMKHTRFLAISAEEGTHVSELMRRTRRFLDGVEAEEAARERERQERLRRAFAEEAEDEDEISETASRVFASGNHRWSIRDARLSQMCFNTDWEYYGAVGRFLKVMESLGVLHELREAGAVNGDVIVVADKEITLAEPPANVG